MKKYDQLPTIQKSAYLSTGELAKIMGISKHTLFYYDEIGLFCPAIKLDNDYRYYSFLQIDLLHIILILKDLGVSLSEIKDFLEKKDTDALQDLLTREMCSIDAKILLLKRQKNWMKQKLEELKKIPSIDYSAIEIDLWEQKYIYYQHANSSDDLTIAKMIGHMRNRFYTLNPKENSTLAFLQYEEQIKSLDSDEVPSYQDVALLLSKKPVGFPAKILEGGNYLTIYHIGHWHTIGSTYQRLLRYINQNHLKTTGPFIEQEIIDNWLVDSYDDYITQIAVRLI